MDGPVEINKWLAVIITGIVTSVANKWIGWEHGDRYTGSAAISFTGYIFFGYIGAFIGVTMLAWRFVGWFRALDIGRDQHKIYRDFFVMGLTTLVPIAVFTAVFYVFGYGYYGLWSAALFILMPTCYAVAMWVPPYTPKYDHISYAEFLAGWVFGIIACGMIITAA